MIFLQIKWKISDVLIHKFSWLLMCNISDSLTDFKKQLW